VAAGVEAAGAEATGAGAAGADAAELSDDELPELLPESLELLSPELLPEPPEAADALASDGAEVALDVVAGAVVARRGRR
jgi:hypothetical protein